MFIQPLTHARIITRVCLFALMTLPLRSAMALERVDLLPKDATITVTVPHMAQFTSTLTNTPMARMWREKQFQDFMGDIDLREEFLSGEAERLGNREAAELQLEELQMLKGEVVFGAIIESEAEFHFAAAAQMSKDAYIDSLDMDRRIVELSTNRTSIINHEFQGHPIVEIREESENSPTETTFQTHLANTLFISDKREWVENSIVKLGEAQELIEPSSEYGRLTVSVNGKQLMELLQTSFDASMGAGAAADATGQPAAQKGVLVDALGLAQIGEILIDLKMLDEKMELTADVTTGRDLKGLLSLLDVRPIDANTTIPYPQDDLYYAMHSRYDLGKLWQEIPNMMRSIMPGSEMMLGMMLMSLGDVDVGRDIFANLDTSYSRIGRLNEGLPEELMLWKLKNPEALGQTLDGLMAEGKPLRAKMGAALEIEEFRDHPIYTFSGGEGTARSGIAVAGDNLLMGSAEMIEASIRALDATQAKTPFMASSTYTRLLGLAPANAFAIAVVDWNRLVKSALNQSGENSIDGFIQMQQAMQAMNGAQDNLLSEMDWAQFPSPQFFARFLGPSLSFSEMKSGVLQSQFILYYPEDQ